MERRVGRVENAIRKGKRAMARGREGDSKRARGEDGRSCEGERKREIKIGVGTRESRRRNKAKV